MKGKNKIQLASTDTCTGCAACASVCPTGSISMKEDREGFLQPHIDTKTCIGCNKCEKTCPILNPLEIPTGFETQAYAAINKDEDVRMRSSSGGMFHALAKWTIEQGGVVFGARFNDQWEVVHDYTETIEGIEPFMRSKYVQSRIGDTFNQAKQFLDSGRQVLFVGTPCQIGGLKAYLKKDYDNLLSVDFICHGVPSPSIWKSYLREEFDIKSINEICFRDKKDGWLKDRCVTINTKDAIIYRKPHMENQFFAGFIGDFYLRRSCYNCEYKDYHRLSDITLSDFWGIQYVLPETNDDRGTSLVFVHTRKGECIWQLLPQINAKLINDAYGVVVKYNASMIKSVDNTYNRNIFYMISPFCKIKVAINAIKNNIFLIRVLRKINKIIVNL